MTPAKNVDKEVSKDELLRQVHGRLTQVSALQERKPAATSYAA